MIERTCLCGMILLLGGCATIISGTSEEVMVNTNPAGAHCTIQRQGATIASIAQTPASANIPKTKYDITVLCDKDGYQQASFIDHSGVQSATFGNIVAGGLIGWGIDSASGADNHYDSPVNLTLVPNQPAASPPGGSTTDSPKTPDTGKPSS